MVETQMKLMSLSSRKMKPSRVTSDEVLGLLRSVASGQSIPRMKNLYQYWTDDMVEVLVDGWKLVLFTDNTRSRHLDSVISSDGRRGGFDDWRSDMQFSQQPEDHLYREDNNAVERMFTAFRRAHQ
jgi:hypothetical protein